MSSIVSSKNRGGGIGKLQEHPEVWKTCLMVKLYLTDMGYQSRLRELDCDQETPIYGEVV